MKAFVSHQLNGIDSLVLEQMPDPGRLGPGQIRIAMKAASLNYRDLLMVSGMFAGMTPQPLIPCSDGAGEVVETGPDVWRFNAGDRVALTYNPHWIGGQFELSPAAIGRGGSIQGVMREQIVAYQDEAVLLPEHLSFEEGASLPCAGVTAWHALCAARPLQPGMTVLTHGTGGVALFALQFAKLFGARVIATSSSPERCAKLKDYGADETIDYRAEPEWNVAVRALTGGRGVDLAIDIGGAETIDRSLASTVSGGRVALVGMLSGMANAPSALFQSGADVTPIKVGSRQDFEAMNRAIGFHKLRPAIDKSFAFEQLPDALRHLESRKHIGKIAIAFG
jgi:NADPH:quinone reductase-like Zn-dependent oxidoreductase